MQTTQIRFTILGLTLAISLMLGGTAAQGASEVTLGANVLAPANLGSLAKTGTGTSADPYTYTFTTANGLDAATNKVYTTDGTSFSLNLNGGDIVATGAATNTVALTTTRAGNCGNITLTAVRDVTLGTIDTHSTAIASAGGNVKIGTSSSDRARTVNVGYVYVGNTVVNSGATGGSFTVYSSGNVAFSNGVSLAAAKPRSLWIDQSTGNFTSDLIDGRNISTSTSITESRTNYFNGGDKSGTFTVTKIDARGNSSNGKPYLQIRNYKQVNIAGGADLGLGGGSTTIRDEPILITDIGSGGVNLGNLSTYRTVSGFSGNITIGGIAGGGLTVGAVDASNGSGDSTRAGGNITIYGVTGNVAVASATAAGIRNVNYQTGDLRIGYRVTATDTAGYPTADTVDPVSGNITITGAIDLNSANADKNDGVMKLAATGTISLASLDLSKVKTASLEAPGNSVITNLFSGFVTNAISGAGTLASPYVTTQTVFRVTTNQFVTYDASLNNYLKGRCYRVASVAGVAGAGGILQKIVNHAPTASNMTIIAVSDMPKGIVLIGTDPEYDPLVFTNTQPAHGSVPWAGGSASVTYTSAPGYSGSDSFDFRVTDGESTSEWATVTITVEGGNATPVVQDQSVTTPEDTATNITLVGTDADPADTLTFSIVTGPTHGTLGTLTGSNVVYTPFTNYFGSDTFTFKANDTKIDSNLGTVTLTVSSVNDLPVTTNQSLGVFWNSAANGILPTATNITLTGSDVETVSLTYAVTTSPAHGGLTGTAPNLTYTPADAFTGVDTFEFTVSDGDLVATGTVTITVWAPKTWYVDVVHGTNLANNGTYAMPWKTITYAIASTVVSNFDTIKVAGGTYSPATGENSGQTGVIILSKVLTLSGGWAFDATAPWTQRTQTTILDGYNSITPANIERVIRIDASDNGATVEYMTIRNGADGGVYAKEKAPRLSHLIIENNGNSSGDRANSGIRLDAGGVIEYCTITNNISTNTAAAAVNSGGGGVNLIGAAPVLIANCVIARNKGRLGGGINDAVMSGNSVVIFNTAFYDNAATNNGIGTVFYKSGGATNYIVNSTIVDNVRPTGVPAAVGVYLKSDAGPVKIRNCILSSNAVTGVSSDGAITVVRGNTVFDDVSSNITWSNEGVNPVPDAALFVNHATGDYRPSYTSSARNAGGYLLTATHATLGSGAVTFTYVDVDNNSSYQPKLDVVVDVGAYTPKAQEYLNHYIYPTTIEGEPRVSNSMIDSGAYKARPSAPGTCIIFL